ncbi:MAG: hypothetical protein GH144_09615 [Clostridia bacterium]|nr:hypothetical protein [Clostridia bacterium]
MAINEALPESDIDLLIVHRSCSEASSRGS